MSLTTTSRSGFAGSLKSASTCLRSTDERRHFEIAGSSVDLVQDRLSLAATTGASTAETRLDELLEKIESLRVRLADAHESVDRVRDRITSPAGAASRATSRAASRAESMAESMADAVTQVATRAVASLEGVQAGLAKASDGLVTTQLRLHERRSATERQVRLIAWAVALLFGWMGAGQVALCRLAWRRRAQA